MKSLTHIFVPLQSSPPRFGLAERFLRRRLERQGWTVWRGGRIDIVRQEDVYPNVRRKYEQLCRLLQKHHPRQVERLQYLCAVHQGMPDFVCYRNGRFKFVECKLQYEPLSLRQKKCIQTLQQLGFVVEVHTLVDKRTKKRRSIQFGTKQRVLEA